MVSVFYSMSMARRGDVVVRVVVVEVVSMQRAWGRWR